MCQAIPRQVLQVTESRLEVEIDGAPTWVERHAVPEIEVGEYVVVYAGQALERMDEDEALAMIEFYESLESMLEEASTA
jgi:hydrogenase expression/formation protein HypC